MQCIYIAAGCPSTAPQSLREDPSGVLGQLERNQESLFGRKPSKHIQLMLGAFVADELHLELTPGPGTSGRPDDQVYFLPQQMK